MDRRSWPWKKKSSDKAEKSAAVVDSGATSGSLVEKVNSQESYKKPSYVQISVESYTHLTGLEDQVNAYEERVQSLQDQIKDLNEKLSAAQSEMTTKENLVKQHAKVAEEAVSGWEKAEAEALSLKNHLESVTLSKLTAEDRASHLDGALKECMRQIRNLKEEHEQKVQEVIIAKNKQFEKMKLEFEANIAKLDDELLRSASDNAALSRSLQEHSNMLIKITEEKTQAEAEIELLKSNVESCEREIKSLKYELHVVSKEMEIRNEEKNMSIRSAEVANKQHIEGVKKIAKLEAECQRLRGLVRKKLPGPAALAQMKLEVESLGRDHGDSRLRRSPVKPSSPHMSPVTGFSLDSSHKDNEFLTERLLAMEEETKMLKEALAKRNSELQASRNLCAKTASRLQSLEAQLQISNQHKGSPKATLQVTAEGYSSQNASNPPSLSSLSEDGNDDVQSCADSWATTSISELSHLKEKNSEKLSHTTNAKHLELMDDFLEMEKLACMDANGGSRISDSPSKNISELDAEGKLSPEKSTHPEGQCALDPLVNHVSPTMDLSMAGSQPVEVQPPLIKLQSRISLLLEQMSKDTDMEKVPVEVKMVLQDVLNVLQQPEISSSEKAHIPNGTHNNQTCPEDFGSAGEKEVFVSGDNMSLETVNPISQELLTAISHIHDFVLFLGKEAMSVHETSSNGNSLSQKIEEFSVTVSKVQDKKSSMFDFVSDLSHVLFKASELRFNVLGYRGIEAEINSSDCIDKVALPEDKIVPKDSSDGRYENGCAHISSPTSNPEVPDDGNLVPSYGPNKVSLEEFEELKLEKDNISSDLARLTDNLELTKAQLHETEQLLANVKSQLTAAEKSNSLAETQLKCMAESYRSLESHAKELETEVNLLRSKTETLENELQDEKSSHEDALARCKELQEQLQMKENCSNCEAGADNNTKTTQEKELAAAAEKLVECQETIFLLGKQLKALCPQAVEVVGSPCNKRNLRSEGFTDNEPTNSGLNLQDLEQAEVDTATSNDRRVSVDSPMELYTHPGSPSDCESNPKRSPVAYPMHRATKSSFSSSSVSTPEKHSRGFSRFFSSKGKNGY